MEENDKLYDNPGRVEQSVIQPLQGCVELHIMFSRFLTGAIQIKALWALEG